MDYQRKVAVVTGGGSGIGRSLAHAFARRGARIVLADIEKPALDAVANELERAGTEVLALRVDVSDSRQVAHLAEAAYEDFGGVHVLCNNAGIAVGGRIKDVSLE
jgi:NAD(P)-dependent dehydrogenase (short-subunit alcohol dehydrogenase family)